MTHLREGRDLADFIPPREKGAARAPRGWLIAHGIAWGVWLIVLTFGVRKLEAIFVDFGVGLPGFTALVIRVSHLGIALVPLLLVVLGVDWFVLHALDRRGEARRYRTWSIAMLVVPWLLFAATIVALAIPFLSILTRLSG